MCLCPMWFPAVTGDDFFISVKQSAIWDVESIRSKKFSVDEGDYVK